MKPLPWFRMYAEFASDPKVQSMSEEMQRRLVMLFCLKCSGAENLSTDEIVTALRISPLQFEEAVTLFKAKGFLCNDGKLRNWNKRQFKSDSSAERVRAFRKRHSNVTVTPSDTDTDTDTDTEKKKTKKPSRARRIPPDFSLSPEMRSQALKHLSDCDPETMFEQFKAFHKAKGTVAIEWEQSWTTWIGNAVNGFKYPKAARNSGWQ